MTVKELIEQLGLCDPEAEVFVNDHASGNSADIVSITVTDGGDIELDINILDE